MGKKIVFYRLSTVVTFFASVWVPFDSPHQGESNGIQIRKILTRFVREKAQKPFSEAFELVVHPPLQHGGKIFLWLA